MQGNSGQHRKVLTMAELKPCPFCGNADIKDRCKRQGNWRKVYIQCRKCNARSGVIDGYINEDYQTLKDEAARLWNRRCDNDNRR